MQHGRSIRAYHWSLKSIQIYTEVFYHYLQSNILTGIIKININKWIISIFGVRALAVVHCVRAFITAFSNWSMIRVLVAPAALQHSFNYSNRFDYYYSNARNVSSNCIARSDSSVNKWFPLYSRIVYTFSTKLGPNTSGIIIYVSNAFDGRLSFVRSFSWNGSINFRLEWLEWILYI